MDRHEPPHSPHSHHLQLENIRLVGPNPFTNTIWTTLMAPTTSRLPLISIKDNSSPHSEPHVNNNMVPSILNPCVGASSETGSIKRKRGRPRKYFLDVNTSSGLGSISGPIQALTVTSPSSSTSHKNTSGRRKGRPNGSVKKKQPVETIGVFGSGFSPHIIFVNEGEDIISKVTAFTQEVVGPNTEICIMSAHGLVGRVAIHQSGSIANYEGQFEIVSLSGNLEVYDNNSGSSKMSYFKVCLVSPDSHLLVGVVADTLVAASSVKVTVGSFTLNGKNASSNNLKYEHSLVTPSQIDAFGTPTEATLQGPSFDSLGGNENNHFRQELGINNNTNNPIPTISMYQQLWAHQSQK